MAAGLSQLRPIIYERPKGTAQGARRISSRRQIRSNSHEAGIANITLVVGCKKILLLADKYGVDIVVNREYATRSNNGSLWLVKDRLDNTCAPRATTSPRTPSSPYVYKSYYSGELRRGPHRVKWCIETGPADRI